MRHIYTVLVSFAKRNRYIIGLIGIQLVVFHNWIFSNRIFTFGDIGVYPPEAQKELFFNTQFFYTGNFGLGDVNIAASSNPFVFLYGFFGKIGINSLWAEKLLFFYPIVFGVVFTSYFLIRYLTKSEGGAFIGALIYAYNTYFLVSLTGALYISLAYAFVPLVFLIFLKVLERPTLVHKLLFAFLATWLGFIEFRVFYITFLMMAIYFSLFLYFKRASSHIILCYIKQFILPGILFVLMNLFWIFPILFVGALTNNVLFDRGLFGNGYFDVVNALAVFHPWWTWNIPSIFVKQTAASFLFVLPLLAVASLFGRLRDSRIYIFLVLFLLGVFLTKQSGAPFDAMYLWLYGHMPGFNAFRESSKFFVVSSLAMAILIGYFFAQAQREVLITSYRRRWFIMASLLLVMSIIFFNAKTVATGDIGTMFIPRDVPKEYSELNTFLSSQKEYSRVLWFPHINRFGLAINNHPAVSMLLNRDTLFADFSKGDQKTFESHLYAPFDDVAFHSFLDEASVKYIVVPSNLVWDEVNSPWKDPENYIGKLDRVPFLNRLDNPYLEQHNIFVYENSDYRPHIYITQGKETIFRNISFEKVNAQFLTPAEYRMQLKDISSPVYVNFSEEYHPDWKIRVGGFHWSDVLTKKDYFLPDSFHSENDAKLNSFLIDPEYIKQNFPKDSYTVNPDGSISLDLTLYFKPQSYFYLGLIISGTTLVLCLGYLSWSFMKKRKRKEP